MSKELIERLRWAAKNVADSGIHKQLQSGIAGAFTESADMIEQLQAKIEMLEALLAGDGALITGLKNDLAAAQGQRNARNRKIEELTDQLAAAQTKIAELESALMNSGLIIESLHAREAKHRAALQKCIDGFEYTRQYVGYEMLPAIDGWSWFDAVVAAKEALAQTEVK